LAAEWRGERAAEALSIFFQVQDDWVTDEGAVRSNEAGISIKKIPIYIKLRHWPKDVPNFG
jgi:hypothetical protein